MSAEAPQVARMMEHPTRSCVAEIVVSAAGGKQSRGSGYLVSDRWVLTAAHVVAGAAEIGVWLGAPRMLDPASGVGVDPAEVRSIAELDLALVPVPAASAPTGFVPPPFGLLDRESAQSVPLVAVGFPRFKLVTDQADPTRQLRESHLATGLTVGLSNARLGTVEWRLDGVPPAPHPGQGRSAWEGMSGAGVFTAPGGTLVGVVGQHSPARDPGTLTVRPLRAEPGRGTAMSARRWWADLVTQLRGPLPVVTPRTVRELADLDADISAMQIAPSVLVGRDTDLSALDRFATDPAQRWRWIRAEAFAGKSALLGWFTRHPPDHVDIVACFLRETYRQNTAAYVLGVLTDQVQARAGIVEAHPDDPGRWAGRLLHRMLPVAADRARQQSRTLLIVIDGLDEYDPFDALHTPLDLWLPDAQTLPPGAKLLVSSRAGAPVALDRRNPLWEPAATRWLAPADAAAAIRGEAARELEDATTRACGDTHRRHVIGAGLAACGGQITLADLAAWLARRGDPVLPGELRNRISLWYHRTIQVTTRGRVDRLAFSHQTLLDQAVGDTFAADLPALRSELHDWAEECAQAGWPADTPEYLLTGYRGILRSAVGSHDPAPPDAVDRIVGVLDDPRYRRAVRRIRGWLVDYVEDIEFLARRAPDRARDVCRRAFEKGYPNSYLRGRLAEVLVSTTGPWQGPPPTRRWPTLAQVASVLASEPTDAGWLTRTLAHYSPDSVSPVAALLVLGVGRVGGPGAPDYLLGFFHTARGQLAWAAADALLVAARPRPGVSDEEAERVRAEVIEGLITEYPASHSDAERRRRLYVLGFLKASEARPLAEAACDTSDPGTLGWAIRLLAATGATSEQVDQWLDRLGEIVDGTATPVWHDEWAQKRLIRALHETPLSADQAIRAGDLVRRLRDLHDVAGTPRAQAARAARRALSDALAQFDSDLGHLDSSP